MKKAWSHVAGIHAAGFNNIEASDWWKLVIPIPYFGVVRFGWKKGIEN
jgi:hypothetical protein